MNITMARYITFLLIITGLSSLNFVLSYTPMTDSVGVGISPPIIREETSKSRAMFNRKSGFAMFFIAGITFLGRCMPTFSWEPITMAVNTNAMRKRIVYPRLSSTVGIESTVYSIKSITPPSIMVIRTGDMGIFRKSMNIFSNVEKIISTNVMIDERKYFHSDSLYSSDTNGSISSFIFL